jgi:S-adenosylmethionine:tRNA ribosyltransferase-isomerase
VSPARWLRERPENDRLLALDVATGTRTDARVSGFSSLLRRGDLVVINDAATLPAMLPARVGERPFELRLASRLADGHVWAVAFGVGDWRTPTENRALPPPLAPNDRVTIDGTNVTARVVECVMGRLLRLRWETDDLAVLDAVYAQGRPIQYSHVDRDLPLWAVQTPLASRPWSVEMPSAGRAFGPTVIAALRSAGVEVAHVTHAAGLSSTGDARLDAMLPLPEDYEIPAETVLAVERTHARGGRVIAMGTTVVRALESAASTGRLVAGAGTATLKLDPLYLRRVVDGIVTGFHEEGSSHLRLLGAFAPTELLASAYEHATRAGYLCHELGDVNLVIAA